MSDTLNSQAVEKNMDKSVATLVSELQKIRTGRAHPSLLEHITVEYYGSRAPLNQVSNITVEESRNLVLTVWEKNMVEVIEKAIVAAGLGLNPVVQGTVMRIPMPALTEERRKELTKVVRQYGESARVAVRNIRRDAIRHLKDAVKNSAMGEDEEKLAQASVDKLSSAKIKKIDEILEQKEAELMAV